MIKYPHDKQLCQSHKWICDCTRDGHMEV